MSPRLTLLLPGVLCGLLLNFRDNPIHAAEPTPAFGTPEQIEVFEKRVRPLLVEHCQSCHGSEEQSGGLRLDSRTAILAGGETGPAIVPGKPDQSELILAISHDPAGYQMPPEGKLPEEAIRILTSWVEQGAPWPAESQNAAAMSTSEKQLTREHWSLHPLSSPALPEVNQPQWTISPVDRFILQKLEQAGLSPAPPASREILLRRACFDLTGLPPSPQLRKEFLADNRPDAFAHLIDQLLESPHYGERWGRHWLDLVRFSETLGHEYDYEIPLAWKYRDYVIRALNSDLPIDQFAIEHIAGDLLTSPRRHPDSGENESVLGTGFYWFSQGKHSPVDIRAEQCDLTDNQIDVLTKTFLATTVSCARCHDHKFDPVTIKDYYALAGIMESSRRDYCDLREQEPIEQAARKLRDFKQQYHRQLLTTTVDQLKKFLQQWTKSGTLPVPEKTAERPENLLYLWGSLKDEQSPEAFARKWQETTDRLSQHAQALQNAPSQTTRRINFQGGLPAGWTSTGQAFSWTVPQGELLTQANPAQPVLALLPGQICHTGLASGKTAGTLRSPTFVITENFIDYHLCRSEGKQLTGEYPRGPLKNGHVHLIVDGFQHIRNPIYGGLSFSVQVADKPVWHRQDVQKWIGHRAYIEISDHESGGLQLDQICFSNGPAPLEPLDRSLIDHLQQSSPRQVRQLLQAYHQLFASDIAALEQIAQSDGQLQRLPAEQLDRLNWLIRQIPQSGSTPEDWLVRYSQEALQLEKDLGTPSYALAMTEGTPLNSPLLVRGNPAKPAAEVPRRFLEVLGGTAESIAPESTGRLELARSIVSPENPLFDRVMVNRVWKYHFGHGLVASPDDFGKMGQLPSHPELLDYLASQFREHGRSLKWLHRTLMNTATYRMTSDLQAIAMQSDPQNRLWHRMPVLRLEGEAIRDALLSLSGQLKPDLYGPSVLPHLTPFMQGRGRPGSSGPVDGQGRRSIYISVRRNFLSPFFLSFDYPLPLTTAGRRSVSNVPAQALTLMNSEFVIQQSQHWAKQLLSQSTASPSDRVTQLYLQAFCRVPHADEQQLALTFLEQELAAGRGELEVWSDLCHVLVNVKEFVYIR